MAVVHDEKNFAPISSAVSGNDHDASFAAVNSSATFLILAALVAILVAVPLAIVLGN